MTTCGLDPGLSPGAGGRNFRVPLMIVEQTCPCDPAVLAARVRNFAALAHRALKDPAFRDRKANELSRQLAFLEEQLEHRPDSALAQWVESARRELGLL